MRAMAPPGVRGSAVLCGEAGPGAEGVPRRGLPSLRDRDSRQTITHTRLDLAHPMEVRLR
eukprot:511133-Prymnesium_polylepis.1